MGIGTKDQVWETERRGTQQNSSRTLRLIVSLMSFLNLVRILRTMNNEWHNTHQIGFRGFRLTSVWTLILPWNWRRRRTGSTYIEGMDGALQHPTLIWRYLIVRRNNGLERSMFVSCLRRKPLFYYYKYCVFQMFKLHASCNWELRIVISTKVGYQTPNQRVNQSDWHQSNPFTKMIVTVTFYRGLTRV